jgi:hypothetical protein
MPHEERQDHSFVKSRLLLSIDALKPYEKDLIKRAVSLAEEVHANHYRLPLKPNLERRTPFVVHPMRVALILIEELGINHPEPISAALLHDIVEDSSGAISTFDLEKQFGRHVALMVSCMTRPAPDPKIPGEQQMAVYYERIAHPIFASSMCASPRSCFFRLQPILMRYCRSKSLRYAESWNQLSRPRAPLQDWQPPIENGSSNTTVQNR